MQSSSLKRALRMFALSTFMLNVLTIPALAAGVDTDFDGLLDEDEAALGFDSSNPDTDGDGLRDGEEDNDGDGLMNYEELYLYITDPSLADTDGDTRNDGSEITLGTDPLVYEAADLDITDISMDPTTGMISYTAVNLGNLDVDYTIDMGYTGVYVNYGEADETMYYYDWNAEMGASSWTGIFFNAGGTEVIESGVGLTSGEHSVMVCIDRAANHGEIASGLDNCEIETFSVGADLTVTDISFVEIDGFPGQFYVYADLANLGDIDAEAGMPGTVTTTLNGGSEQVYNWTSLDPSLTGFLSANTTTLDFESFGSRPYLVNGDVFEVCVDSSDLINELDESNNCLSATYSDGTLPDLVVDSVTFNTSDGSVSFVVRNAGSASVAAGEHPYLNFTLDLLNSDLSTSSSINYDIDSHGTDYRTPEGVTTVNTGPAVEDFPSCTMYVLAIADSTGDVAESDDFNNEFRTTLDLCPGFSVEAGNDQGIVEGNVYTLAASTYGAVALDSATVDWGDGSPVETPTQSALVGEQIDLTSSHLYDHQGTYLVTVCADSGLEELCDTLNVSITGTSSSGSGPTMSSTSDSSGTAGSSNSTDSGTDDSGADNGETDQDVTLTEEEELAADCSAMVFDDVSSDDDFYDAVCELWGTEVIQGKTANFFDSEDVIRRDEASKIFTRMFGYVTEAYGETPAAEGTFSDVNVADPLAYYVEVAHEEGIVTGDVDTEEATFNPHDAITAQEIADALKEILGDNTAGEQLDADGYSSDDSMTRGSFVEFLYGLSR